MFLNFADSIYPPALICCDCVGNLWAWMLLSIVLHEWKKKKKFLDHRLDYTSDQTALAVSDAFFSYEDSQTNTRTERSNIISLYREVFLR